MSEPPLKKSTPWLDKLGTFIAGVGVMILGSVWAFGGLIGAIYWALENDLLNVVLSMFIPGYGAISVLLDII